MRQRNGRVPLLVIASLTGALASVGSGMLIGQYATSGINPLGDPSAAVPMAAADTAHAAIWGARATTDEPTTPVYQPEEIALR